MEAMLRCQSEDISGGTLSRIGYVMRSRLLLSSIACFDTWGQTMQKKRLDMNLNSRSASGSLSEACVQMDSTLSQTMPEKSKCKMMATAMLLMDMQVSKLKEEQRKEEAALLLVRCSANAKLENEFKT